MRQLLSWKSFALAVALFSAASHSALSQSREKEQKKSAKVTITLHGAHCKDCADRLRASLRKLSGVKFKEEEIKPTKKPRTLKPRYFSLPFEVTLEDIPATDIGSLAAAVKKGGTRHQDDVETGVNVILFPSRKIDEELVMDFRARLRNVNGLEVDANGGLGGKLSEQGFIWIRLEEAGGAGLEEVLRAAREVDPKIRTTRPKKDSAGRD